MKWIEQWFDPCWVDPRLVPYHARLEWSHLSNQHRVGVVVQSKTFCSEKSFISEGSFHTVLRLGIK